MSVNAMEQERVAGFEMEYSPSLIFVPDNKYDNKKFYEVNSSEMLSVIEEKYISSKYGFLEIGYRACSELELTEICLPESTPNNVGQMQLGSELLAEQALKDVAATYADDKPELQGNWYYFLPLRVSNDNSTSGFHENYQIQNDTFINDERLLNNQLYFLALYAATANVWTGQGNVSVKKENFEEIGVYDIAQKVGLHTSGGNDLVEYKGDPSTGMRYEFRRNNYPVSHWQLKYRSAYTSAVIRAYEQGAINTTKYQFFKNAEDIPQLINEDPHTKLELCGRSKRITAVEYQMWLAGQVASIAARRGFPEYEQIAATQVAEVCTYLHDEKYEQVAMAVPWVLKEFKLSQNVPDFFDYCPKYSNTLVEARQICISLDGLGLGGVTKMVRNKQALYSTSDVAISHTPNAPCLSIAKSRGRHILAKGKNAAYYYADWMTDELVDSRTVKKTLH